MLIRRKLNKVCTGNYIPHTKFELIYYIVKSLKSNEKNLNNIDLSNIDDLSYVFSTVNKYVHVKEIDLSSWDVYHVRNFKGMFENCRYLIRAGISNWNMSNAVNLSAMFNNCEKYRENLSSWNTYNVVDFHYMFNRCFKLKTDFSYWDISAGEDFNSMFAYCKKFDSDITGWNMMNAVDIGRMFSNCTKFSGKGLMNIKLDFNKLKNTNDMLFGCNVTYPNWYKE